MELTEMIPKKTHTKCFAQKVYWKQTVDSTNLWAGHAVRQGAENGSLFVADVQTAGRGRRGRSWEAEEGAALNMSLLLATMPVIPQNAPMLTLVMGLSVTEALQELCGVQAKIKWPNDIVLSGKKVCGILTEMRISVEGISHIIVGVGINLGQRVFPEELSDKATSLYLETGREFDRADVAAKVMEAFERNYDIFCETQDMSELKTAYEAVLVNMGQPVRVLDPEPAKNFEGIARGIDNRGELLVETPDQKKVAIFSGEVSVRGLYGYI